MKSIGAAIAIASGLAFAVIAIGLAVGAVTNPYAGLVVGVALPALFLIGLLLIPAGRWAERRWTLVTIAPLTIVNLAIVLLASYGGLHAMESPTFCGAVCHTPMQPQFVAWKEGPHAATACVRCHIGEGPAAFVHAKLAGVRQLAHVVTNSYARPTPPGTDMPPGAQAQTCVGCHRLPHAAGDRLRTIREYGDDEANSETTTTLHMRMGAIHWHADPANRVEYVATDDRREPIPYLKVTRATGEVREFVADDTSKAPPDGVRRTMDCVDCHNTVGHPMAATPERAVDDAIGSGVISRALPHARREGVRLVKASYASQDEAAAAIEREFRAFYRSQRRPVDDAAVARSDAALQALYRRTVFPAMKVTWGSYPDNRGHLTSSGCFRSHDGSHADKTGAVITADCESCHTQLASGQEGS